MEYKLNLGRRRFLSIATMTAAVAGLGNVGILKAANVETKGPVSWTWESHSDWL